MGWPGTLVSPTTTLKIEEEIVNVFLPKRFVNILNDEKIKIFTENNIQMKYCGGEYHQIEFI